VEDQKDQVLKRLENLFKNLDSGFTRDKYLELCEQMGNEPIEEEIPPDWEDFPDVVIYAINTFNMLGDRVFPEIGYVGKDYTTLPEYLDLYEIQDKEYFLQLLSWLDSRAIKQSSDELKRQYEKAKRQSSGGKRNKTHITG
jgi:hypothetical protein